MQLILCAKQAISLRLAYFNSSPSDTFFWSPLFPFPELVSDLLPEQNDWLRIRSRYTLGKTWKLLQIDV